MKFSCPTCEARYGLADDKVPSAVGLRFTCRRCGTVIRLRRSATVVTSLRELEGAASTRVVSVAELDKLRGSIAAHGETVVTTSAAPTVIQDISPTVAAMAPLWQPEPGPLWYTLVGKQQRGPLSLAELRELNRAGELAPRAYVWREGMADWVRAAEVPELARDTARVARPPDKSTSVMTADDLAAHSGRLTEPLAEELHEALALSSSELEPDPEAAAAVTGDEPVLLLPKAPPPRRSRSGRSLLALGLLVAATVGTDAAGLCDVPGFGALYAWLEVGDPSPLRVGVASAPLPVTTDGQPLVLRAPDVKDVSAPGAPVGLSRAAIAEVIREGSASAQGCLTDEADAAAPLEVQLTIAPDGAVSAAEVTSRAHRGSALAECVGAQARAWRFPSFEGEPVIVVFPYVLSADI